MKTKAWFGGTGLVLAGLIAYTNHNLPLIYAIVGLGLLDVLFNIKDENALIKKMGKTLLSVLIPVVVGVYAHRYTNTELAINAAAAVVIAAELSSIGPELISFIRHGFSGIESDLPMFRPELQKLDHHIVTDIKDMTPTMIEELAKRLDDEIQKKAVGDVVNKPLPSGSDTAPKPSTQAPKPSAEADPKPPES